MVAPLFRLHVLLLTELASPATESYPANFECLKYFANALACGKHRIGVSKLLDDLLG